MKTSRDTEEQVADTLRLAESGTPVADVCRQMGIAEATFYLWNKKYGSLGATEVRELRRPARRRELAQWIHDRFQVSTRRASVG